jgi:hypothetical protein
MSISYSGYVIEFLIDSLVLVFEATDLFAKVNSRRFQFGPPLTPVAEMRLQEVTQQALMLKPRFVSREERF